jgi:hypothetical protein
MFNSFFELINEFFIYENVSQVCTRWRDVLDADEKLWPKLLLTEFKWKKTERRGKGRNKKNKKIEQINYREQYGKLYREHEVPLAPLAPIGSHSFDSRVGIVRQRERSRK